MWHSVRYKQGTGVFPHVVQDDLLDWHNDYIKSTYNLEHEDAPEETSAWIDPGGAIMKEAETIIIKNGEDNIIKIRAEHILAAMEIYFSDEIYDSALGVYLNESDDPVLYPVRIKNDYVIKVYFPYYILVTTHENYLSICEGLKMCYLDGVNAMIDISLATDDPITLYAAVGLLSGGQVIDE